MLNTKRKNKIRTLLENNNASIEDLKTAINIISISSFCCGKNDRGWKATFDWLINDTNSCFSRLLEGSFLSNNEERKEYSRIIGRSSSSASSGKPDNITLSDEEYESNLSLDVKEFHATNFNAYVVENGNREDISMPITVIIKEAL